MIAPRLHLRYGNSISGKESSRAPTDRHSRRGRGKQFELTGQTVTVGRHSANSISLHDTQVSRRHLELRASGPGYELIDLGSGNGTLLNGQPVKSATLRSGDTITLGQTMFMFTFGRNEQPDADRALTERVKLQARPEQDLASAIVRTVAADVGSQILSRPAAANDWLRGRLASLAALYETAEAVSHILDVEQLLSTVSGPRLQVGAGRSRLFHAPRRRRAAHSESRALPRRHQPAGRTRRQPHGR